MIIFHILWAASDPAEGGAANDDGGRVLDRRARTAHISCERIDVRSTSISAGR